MGNQGLRPNIGEAVTYPPPQTDHPDLIRFRSWKEINDSDYKQKQYGFDLVETWHNLVPMQRVDRLIGQITDLIHYFIEIDEALGLPAPHKNAISSYFTITNILCIIHQNRIYRCSWRDFAITYKYVKELWYNDEDLVSLMFIYGTCLTHYQLGMRALGELTRGPKFCPNPCTDLDNQGNYKNPCLMKKNTRSGHCEIHDPTLMVYKDNFKCDCNDFYYWDQILLECRVYDVCNADPNKNPCGGFQRAKECEMMQIEHKNYV